MKENETTNVDHKIEVCLSALEENFGLKPYSKARATIREYLKANGDIVIALEGKNKQPKYELPNTYKVNGKEVKKGTRKIEEPAQKEDFELGE